MSRKRDVKAIGELGVGKMNEVYDKLGVGKMSELPKFPSLKNCYPMDEVQQAVFISNLDEWCSEFVARLEALIKAENLSLTEGRDLVPNLGKKVLEAFR